MSQEELAGLAFNGDLRRLQRVEAGKYDVRLTTVATLARFLAAPSSTLLTPAQLPSPKRGRPRKA